MVDDKSAKNPFQRSTLQRKNLKQLSLNNERTNLGSTIPSSIRASVSVQTSANKPVSPLAESLGNLQIEQSVCDSSNLSRDGNSIEINNFTNKNTISGKRNFKKKLTLNLNNPSPAKQLLDHPSVTQVITTPISDNKSADFTINKEFNENCDYQLQDLVQLGKLGAGNSGTVLKVLHVPTSKVISKKIIPIEKNNDIINKQLKSELEIMKSIKRHSNIISFYGAFLNEPLNNEIIILMEYMDCGSLDKILTTYKNFQQRNPSNSKDDLTWFNDPLVLSKICFSVLNGLVYLYDNYKILHRDIKPSNVLISSKGGIKICDFGVSKKLINNSIADTFVGTSTYMSPERIQGNVYSTKGDVWSLGLMIIELVTGQFPLGGHHDTPDGILDLLQRIVNEPPPSLPKTHYFPPEMLDFVNRCCVKNEKERSSISELLHHDFIIMYNNHDQSPTKQFRKWCKLTKVRIKEDRQLRREAIERAKLEKLRRSNRPPIPRPRA